MLPEATTPSGNDKKIIFIVEDNEIYAKSLQTFIHENFNEIEKIKIYPIGEMCIMELERNPNIIIVDYFLNSKYAEANNGLEIIKRIKLLKPNTNIIILSSQDSLEIVSETITQYDCNYISKDEDAFNKIKLTIKEILGYKNLPNTNQLN